MISQKMAGGLPHPPLLNMQMAAVISFSSLGGGAKPKEQTWEEEVPVRGGIHPNREGEGVL